MKLDPGDRVPTSTAYSTAGADAPDAALKAAMLDALGEAVAATDEQGRIVYWNDAAHQLFGWTAEEVVGTHLLELLVTDELRPRAESIFAAVAGGEPWSGEYMARHRDGSDLVLLVTGRPIRNQSGEVIGVIAVARDVSGQQQAQDALRTSEERLHLVRRAAQSVIWELDLVSRTVQWSDALTDVFGYAPEEIESSVDWWLERVHPEDRSRVDGAFASFLNDDRQFWTEEYRFRRADGSYAEVFDRAYATRWGTGEQGRIAGAMVDLTERRRLQDERRLLGRAGMILDLSLDYEATLPTLAQLLATELAEFAIIHIRPDAHTSPVLATAHADPARQALLDDMARAVTGSPAEGSVLARVLEDGESFLLRDLHTGWRAAPSLPDELLRLEPRACIVVPLEARSEVLGLVLLGAGEDQEPLDEPELRVTQEVARRIGLAVDHARMYEAEQQARRAKADFLSVVSHELRTPITAVLGYADLLGEEIAGPLNPNQKRQVQRIRAGTDRLHRLIESILAYARLEAGDERPRMARVELARLLDRVEDVIEPRAREERIDFEIERGEALEIISSDPDRLFQVLLALLTNAVKFARAGTVRLRTAERDGWLELDVEDSGPGIPPEHQAHVFNAFWQAEQPTTRRAGGAGLGLSVARRLARLLGGDVVIAHSSPAGTTFRLRLPLKTAP